MRSEAIDVRPVDDYKLVVTFNNGEVKLYDAKPLMQGDWFGQLKDME
jgi:hypothetical protein